MNKTVALFCLAIAVIAIPFLNGCNELPTDVAYPMVYDTMSVAAVSSLDYENLITGQRIINLHKGILNSGGLLIGQYGDTKSAAFIRCGDLPDSLQYMTADRIISAKLTLKANRWAMGDSTGNLHFGVYKVKKLWMVSATWDSIFTSPADYIDYSKVIASYNDPIPLSEDMVTDVVMDFDKELAAEWLKYGSDTSQYINLGIAMVPSSDCNQIRRFAAQHIASTSDSIVYYNNLQVVYLDSNNVTDTITLNSAMDYTLSTATLPSDDEFVLQGATQFATQLDFDFSVLPDNIAIHSATLLLTLDPDKSVFSNYNTDSLRDYQLSSIYYAKTTDTASADTLTPVMYASRLDDHYTYKFSLFTYAAEYLNAYAPGRKGSVIFTRMPVKPQYLSPDKYVFHGINDPNIELRPRLQIIYSRRPDYSKGTMKGESE